MEKRKADVLRIGGKDVYNKMIQKRAAGHYFSGIREQMIVNGRSAAIKQLIESYSRDKFIFSYFIKSILIVLVGPVVWDHFRRWRGLLFWKLKT